MKHKFFLPTFVLIISIISACSSTKQLNFNSEYETSKSVWQTFKKNCNNSYKYTVTFNSWTGFGWDTEITVKNGIVVQRKFKYNSTEKGALNNIKESDLQWTETESKIGSHENGAKPITLDKIYDLAEQDWLSKKENAKAYFETKNNGMISVCGYVENDCMDDCFIGVRISNIQAI